MEIKSISNNRDAYIDFYRGIGVIAILLHHTVYWSGDIVPSPDIIRNLSRLIEVPLFIYLSGWSAYYSHKLDRIFLNLFTIWVKWILFISIVDVIYVLCADDSNLTSFTFWLRQCYFSTESTYLPKLPVLSASMWFMPMFIVVQFLGGGVLAIKDTYGLNKKYIIYIIVFLLIGLGYLSLNGGDWFMLSQNVCFYGIMYLVGYLSPELTGKNKQFYLFLMIFVFLSWWGVSFIFEIPAAELIGVKKPPHLMFLFASMVCVVLCLFLYNNISEVVDKLKYIQFIGRNSLCYYFSQGVACSFSYIFFSSNSQLVSTYPWELLLLFALLFNIVVGLILGTMFCYLLQFLNKLGYSIYNHKS